MDHKDFCEHTRIRLIAAAAGHQQCTKTASNIVPIPGGDRVIAIGTAAQVRALLPAEVDERCQHCDGTGDVHTPTGEWLGPCSCQVEETADEQPDRGAAQGNECERCEDGYVYDTGHTRRMPCRDCAPSPASQPVAPKPYGWIQFVDGQKTQNFARDEIELKQMKEIAALFVKDGQAVEYVQVFDRPVPAVAPSDAKGKADAANAGGLLPCPFCGVCITDAGHPGGDCWLFSVMIARDDIDTWNRRVPATSAADAKDAAPVLYTCIGKGGEYELVGTATGAGVMSKFDNMRVYRGGNGRLYYRTCDDFDARMRRIERAATAAAPSSEKGGASTVPLTSCAAGRDGECGHAQCPQLRDGEPRATGRHCPLDSEGGHHD